MKKIDQNNIHDHVDIDDAEYECDVCHKVWHERFYNEYALNVTPCAFCANGIGNRLETA